MTANRQTASLVLPTPRLTRGPLNMVERYLEAANQLPLELELLLVAPARGGEPGRELAAQHPMIRVVEVDRWSWGRAVTHGLKCSTADILGYTNMNRTSPDTLRLMLAYAFIYRGVVLKANRRTRDSIVQRVGSLLYNLECRSLFKLADWDVNGTPKIFPRSCHKLLELRRDDDVIDAEFMLVCKREAYPVLEVPITALPHEWDWPRTNVRDALRMYAGALTLWRTQRER